MPHFPYDIIDLTHVLSPSTPTWDLSCGFEHKIHHDYDPQAEFQFRTHKIAMNEGIGTHMDAPAHCITGSPTIEQIPLKELIYPCVVVDISANMHELRMLSREDLTKFEQEHGQIEADSFVLIRTGWESRWSSPKQYHNDFRFPSVSSDAAHFLVHERNIAGIGIDTLSPDRGDQGFPVHKLVLGAGKVIVENAANLAGMPVKGSFVVIAPMKIAGGTEAPVRLMGLVPQ